MKWFWRILTLLFLISAGFRWANRFYSDNLRIIFFDVGQGDSALVRFPQGRTLLIDGGGGWGERNIGSRELLMELTRLSILHLDSVALSHPDQDHAYGLLGIFDAFSVGELWFNQFSIETPKPLLTSVLDTAKAKHISLHPIAQSDRLEIEGVKIERIPLHRAGPKSNNRSLVLILDFHGCRIFFGGDIEKGGEEEIVPMLKPLSILKVSHHGSKTSSTADFLNLTQPKIAVISVGRGNTYGHPHSAVLRRFRTKRTQVFRTDFHGFVSFEISKEGNLSCENALGNCGGDRCESPVVGRER